MNQIKFPQPEALSFKMIFLEIKIEQEERKLKGILASLFKNCQVNNNKLEQENYLLLLFQKFRDRRSKKIIINTHFLHLPPLQVNQSNYNNKDFMGRVRLSKMMITKICKQLQYLI